MGFNKLDCPFFDKEKCTVATDNKMSAYCNANTECPCRVDYYKSHPENYILFGKYKYKEYEDVPQDYLAWALKKANLPEERRKYIEDFIVKLRREKTIKDFIEDKYSEYRRTYHRRSYRSYHNYCPADLDYGGDLFDAMQGCCPNGY